MIQKKIYYCWFWKNKKNKLIKKCINSWKRNCPDYQIIEINESNFDINQNNFCKKAYNDKKWAFVADYARLQVVYDNWWIYLDTDMEIIKPIDIFLNNNFFAWYESLNMINFAIFWAKKNSEYICSILNEYKKLNDYITIPKIWTNTYNKLNSLDKKSIMIYSPEYFYPYRFNTKFNCNCITENSYWIHWWETSWHPISYKILKKIWLLWLAPKIWKLIIKILWKNT